MVSDLEIDSPGVAFSAASPAPAVINPLEYPAWDSLVAAHPNGSFFHGTGWSRVLHETYRHQPAYFCRLEAGRLQELLTIMEVSSRWTGRRGVSLPFSDFSSSFGTGGPGRPSLFELAMAHGRARGWRYLECRGGSLQWPGASPSVAFYGHVIDLESDEEALFKRLDSAMRRGIRKAERAGVQIEFSADLASIRGFYDLHCRTRHRHGLPPQPVRFFEHIARYVLLPGHGFVATARLGQRALASAVFFHQGNQALYKFGASDTAAQELRPNNLMMWAAMKRCASLGFKSLHLGRTSLANEGLRRFKLSFGSREENIEYFKFDFARNAFITATDRAETWVNHVFRCLPPPLLRLAGRTLYPHLS